jgi:hypothetical protein
LIWKEPEIYWRILSQKPVAKYYVEWVN